jgi:hypothetical protein
MKVKVTFVEIVWDNYQGGRGLPIKRDLLVSLPDEIKINDVENEVIHALTAQGIKGTFTQTEKTFPYDRIISIELPLVFPST